MVVVDRVISFEGSVVSDRGGDVAEAGPDALSAAAEAFWALSAADAQAVSGHLGGCAACRATFERVGAPIDLPSPEDPADRYTFVPLAPMPANLGLPAVRD